MIYKNDEELEVSPSKYLKYLYLINESPNTIRASAFALAYYYNYMDETGNEPKDIAEERTYLDQSRHFTDFLRWISSGSHSRNIASPCNKTCNKYLRVVFQFYGYLYANGELEKPLKVVTMGGAVCGSNCIYQRKQDYE